MSEQQYIAILHPNDSGWLIGKHQTHGRYVEANIAEVIDILNKTTPPQPAGIVWRKPGEAGRVDGKCYLVLLKGGSISQWSWKSEDGHDGWEVDGVTAWADLPSPPAWASGGAA